MAKRLKLCEVHSISTSTNSCQCTMLLNADVPRSSDKNNYAQFFETRCITKSWSRGMDKHCNNKACNYERCNERRPEGRGTKTDNTSTRHARQAAGWPTKCVCLTLCQQRRASAATRCQSAMCRVVMRSKQTASVNQCRRHQPMTALKHTSVWQQHEHALSPSTVHRTVHDAAAAAIHTNTQRMLITVQQPEDCIAINGNTKNIQYNTKLVKRYTERQLKWLSVKIRCNVK